jgi:zinc-ribbon domain
MFCPKCGMQNPETGKFCRSCGTDLGTVSDALSGKSSDKPKGFGMMEPIQPVTVWNHKRKPITLESAFGKLFMGIAFVVVAIILGFTGKASGWWFWMLIPGLGMLGSGAAQYIQIKNSQKGNVSFAPQNSPNEISAPQNFPDRVSAGSQNTALPPTQTEYVSADPRYKTGDLVPPSVTDGTTRHLELDKEGETMTLPKREK